MNYKKLRKRIKNLESGLKSRDEMAKHYEEMFSASCSELRFYRDNSEYQKKLLKEVEILLSKDVDKSLIKLIISNGIEKSNIDFAIHNNLIAKKLKN